MSDVRTLFIWEGVTQYLTEDAVRATLGALQAAPAGSRLVFTYVRRDFIDGVNMYGAAMLYKRFRQRQQVWKFGLNPDEVAGFIAEYGWQLVEQTVPSSPCGTTSGRPDGISRRPIWSGRPTRGRPEPTASSNENPWS